jgi:glycerol kinase
VSNQKYILAIDQGTSSTKTLVFDKKGQVVARGVEPLHTQYGDNGFVEQDPEEIYRNVLISVAQCLRLFSEKGLDKKNIATIGISNQRETFVVWDANGKPLHNAVVWQCKRSVEVCTRLKEQGLTEMVRGKTGLVIDPYFSATKLIWLFENDEAVRTSIKSGEAFFGTIDSWLLYRLTGGGVYATDYTNASRTLFFNLHELKWDEELINAFGLKGIRLPELRASSFHFGDTTMDGMLDSPVSINAMIGDSHSAAFGEGCFAAGTAKATLGTGCSILMNIGNKPVQSAHGMVTTICWSTEDRVDYALEGVIVSCGATIEWLKNELKFFADSRETESMARMVKDNGGVYLVPAFSGLGSPHWQMNRKASITGMSFGTNPNHIVRAAMESIPFQIMDVIRAMELDAGISLQQLMTDGGMTANQFLMQMIADILEKSVAGMGMADVSALGAAYMAGLGSGIFENLDSLKTLNPPNKIFTAGQEARAVAGSYQGWLKAIEGNLE